MQRKLLRILDDGPKGAWTQQSLDDAIAKGVYGSWTPSAAELTRLKEIFPTGVCDYTQPDVGRP